MPGIVRALIFAAACLAASPSPSLAQADHAPSLTLQEVTRAVPTPEDKLLNERVRWVLQEDSAIRRSLREVQLKTVQGVVNLKGSVESQAQKNAIEQKVLLCPGVVKIQNFIRASDIETSA